MAANARVSDAWDDHELPTVYSAIVTMPKEFADFLSTRAEHVA